MEPLNPHSTSKNRTMKLVHNALGVLLLFFTLAATGQVKKAFSPRFTGTVNGDVTMIANNVLSRSATANYNGNDDNHDFHNNVFVDIDSDSNTFNSSSATLTNPAPGTSCLTFKKAYLYWAAADKEYGDNTGNGGSEESWDYKKVKLMLPSFSNYQTITADEVLYRGREDHSSNDPYICVKDITTEVQSLASPYGKYQIANVKATEGDLYDHSGTHTGTSGGWQIVFVYESPDLLGRNITLFDGYAHITSTQNNFDIDFNGFQTVPNGAVNADILIGSLEGDRDISGDKLQILDTGNNWTSLSTAKRNSNNFFNSRITLDGNDYTSRNPASTNTLGFDAGIFPLSNGSNQIIGNNQTSAKLRMTSDQEVYGLYLLGLSIQVWEPSLGALNFTTTPSGTNFNAGDNVQLSLGIENSGNDNIKNLEFSTILPIEVDFVDTETLPPGTTHSFDSGTRELKFFVEDGYTDTDDAAYTIDFNVLVKEKCYFLETACSANFQIQATASYTGEVNNTPRTTNSSGSTDDCGIGNHDPTVVTINRPDQVNWSTLANELDRTVSCDDPTALSAAQSLEPSTEFCSFTLNKTSGSFVPNSGCAVEGTYVNTFTFTDACGRVSETFTQTISITDTDAPTFNGTLPQDTVAAYDNIPGPDVLTANDNCDTNAAVNLVETYNGDPTGTTYTIIRTWTASDCAGNDTVHSQKIFVTENGDPIGLAINDVVLGEDGGTAVFRVALTGDFAAFTVDYGTADGSASAPGDFTAIVGNSLSFLGNHGETKTIDIAISDDSLVEASETYTVELSNVLPNIALINDASGLGTINDNDSATIVVEDVSVDESENSFAVKLTLNGNVQNTFTLDFGSADGSALNGSDYIATNGQVTFPANASDGDTQSILLNVTDDDLIEASENYFVNLSNINASGDVSIADNQGTITITDNDAVAGTGIAFDATSVTVDEAAGTATFTVRLTGNVPGGFTLDYATQDGSAAAPGDFSADSGQIAFNGDDGESHDIDVAIIDDQLIEATEDFNVTLSNISTALIGINTPSATGNITDNDAVAGTGIAFDATSVTVDEAAGTATFTVRLTGNVPGGFTLDYATQDGSAAAPGDFSADSGQIAFNGDDGESHDIDVAIIDDQLIEATEDFNVTLSNISTALIGINTPSATGNITDNDAVAGTGIAFDATSVTVDEAAGTATFTVRLTGNVPGGFTLDYATQDGSAAAPGDFSADSGQIAFNGDDGESHDIDVAIIDDQLIEATEDFNVTLSNISTALIGINTPSATGNITDNDAVAGTGIAFDATSVTVDEAAGTATFTVRLTGNVPGGFTLDYATQDGSAAAPGDFSADSGQIAFNGDDGESHDIDVAIIDDQLIEATEDFNVTLSNISTALIGINTPSATGNITDNDAVAGTGIAFDATSVTVDEAAGTATFTVRLTGNVPGGFTLDYATQDGSAAAPGDFSADSGQIAFNGDDGESHDIDVAIIDDQLIEATEDFNVTLSNISTALIGINTPSATGNITDNDAVAGTGIAFDATSVTVDEAAGTATFTVRLTGNVPGGFTLDYATQDGSAAAPGDFSADSGQIAFNGDDGESHDIDVAIIDDQLIEATEDFNVTLSNISTALIGINTPSATGNITDNDAVAGTGIAFDATSVTVDEAAGTATFTVRLTGNVPGGFTLDYATQDGSAAAPGDFSADSGQIAFNGDDGESHDIDVAIIDDQLIEATEDFNVTLSNISTALIGINTPSATGNITDNDAVAGTGIAFDATSVTVDEAAGTATFTVRLTGNVPGGFTLDYATQDGSAAAPGDFSADSGQIAFNGDDGESHDIDVAIIDDQLIEATEDFNVTLSNISTALIGINTPSATGNITDNDAVAGTGIAFDATSVTVDEAAGTATFTVRLTGNVPGGFTLDYATQDGSAAAPGDFSADSGQIAFNGDDGESHDIDVAIIDDQLIEATEDFNVTLSNISTALIGINTPSATGNITDNDAVAGTGIAFDATSVTVDEAAGTATFTVRLTGNVPGGFTLDYATQDGSAAAPGDFSADSGQIAFNGDDGESHDIDVAIIDDQLIEATEDFNVTLSNISTALIGINTPSATGNITDNDAVAGTGIAFDATSVTVDEAAGTATFTVRLTGNVPGGFTLDYATQDGSAAAPGDFSADSGQIAFNGDDGESHDIDVAIIDDQLIEATEDFNVTLSNISTALIGINTPSATGNITDNDAVAGTGIAFDATSVTVDEAAGTATFTVRLTGNVQDPFTVDFTTVDGSANAMADYSERNGSLSFNGTDGENHIISVPIIDDVVVETTEDFAVALSNISTAVIGINTPQAMGNITDNDSTDDFPGDRTVNCDEVPAVETLNLNSANCAYTEVFDEIISGQDDECASEYTITRTWTVTDCVGNVRVHTQTLLVEDTSAPTFVEALPQDMTVACNMVPDAATLTALDNCDTHVNVLFEETTTNDGNCALGYTISRNWTAVDCAGNETPHTQVITILPTGPITASDYDKELTVLCGGQIPQVPNLVFTGGCGNFEVEFTEETILSEVSDDFMIIRTWAVSDACKNMETFEQIIFVMQPRLEEVTIDICVEDAAIDLTDYLPESFDTNGRFESMSGTVFLNGSVFDPLNLEVGEYQISYSSDEGECKYYVDFTIRVNADCVPCGRNEIKASTAVTPNGDGVNDYFEIKGVEYCDFKFDVMLFNRWGTKVFEGQDYQNDWGGYAPDRSFGNSGTLPSGTYYYIINITNKDFEPVNGYIYLGTK